MNHDVTHLLNQIGAGDHLAADRLLPLVYDHLRSLARQKLRNESAGQTLQGTALVHEAYIKLVGNQQQQWENRRHFFAAAAEAMRRILVDNARRKKSVKHGGDLQREELHDVAQNQSTSQDDILAINEALEKFRLEDPDKAELVKLRYFAGLTLPEIAEVLGISRATASRHWTYARAWLYDEIFSGAD
jgi:RNA polymerase sigma factor (TIGR02999 family)